MLLTKIFSYFAGGKNKHGVIMENWVIVYTDVYPWKVHTAQSLLEANGIKTFVRDELTSQVIAFSMATGGVKLLVCPRDAERAAKILAEGGY